MDEMSTIDKLARWLKAHSMQAVTLSLSAGGSFEAEFEGVGVADSEDLEVAIMCLVEPEDEEAEE